MKKDEQSNEHRETELPNIITKRHFVKKNKEKKREEKKIRNCIQASGSVWKTSLLRQQQLNSQVLLQCYSGSAKATEPELTYALQKLLRRTESIQPILVSRLMSGKRTLIIYDYTESHVKYVVIRNKTEDIHSAAEMTEMSMPQCVPNYLSRFAHNIVATLYSMKQKRKDKSISILLSVNANETLCFLFKFISHSVAVLRFQRKYSVTKSKKKSVYQRQEARRHAWLTSNLLLKLFTSEPNVPEQKNKTIVRSVCGGSQTKPCLKISSISQTKISRILRLLSSILYNVQVAAGTTTNTSAAPGDLEIEEIQSYTLAFLGGKSNESRSQFFLAGQKLSKFDSTSSSQAIDFQGSFQVISNRLSTDQTILILTKLGERQVTNHVPPPAASSNQLEFRAAYRYLGGIHFSEKISPISHNNNNITSRIFLERNVEQPDLYALSTYRVSQGVHIGTPLLIRSKSDFSEGNPENPRKASRCNADATKISDWLIWVTLFMPLDTYAAKLVQIDRNEIANRLLCLLRNSESTKKEKEKEMNWPKIR
ncbi:hypothetical protein WN51_07741 [Melipona quadrifasciata]|uniref:Uncharacterized protein n=1 Tax=Melipona quadrifasciata TaxID=166423 RepID=A0A0M9A6N2_9HYME|nr:hypothetical protein WN51_07741 [Melipona quadrifasciata]